MKRVTLALLVIGLVLSMNLTAPHTASAQNANQSLRIGYSNLPQSLDPAAAADKGTSSMLRGLFEGLVRLDRAGQAVPGVAESWKVSADGTTYTFKLRPSAKWSNQQPVKALDFEYAWKRALAPKAQSPQAFKMFMIANAEAYHQGKIKEASKVGVKALNNNTLQVTLNRKTSFFLQLVTENIYLPVNAAIAQHDHAWAYNAKTVVTNGAFQLKEWNSKQMKLVKNPSYYAANDVKLTEVNVVTPKQGKGIVDAFNNQEVDWVDLDEGSYAALDKRALSYSHVLSTGASYYYQFNLNEPPFHNVKIRKALAMAVERQMIPYGKPAYGIIPYGIRGTKGDYRAEVSDKQYFNENTDLAQKLLKEGLKEEGQDALPSFSIIVNKGFEHELIAKYVTTSWKKNLGIDVNVESVSFEDLLKQRANQQFTIARSGWGADYNDPSSMLEYFTSKSPDNDSGWSNERYDALIVEAQQTNDPKKRNERYAQAEKLLMDQMIILPLYYYVTNAIYEPYVQNMNVLYDGSLDFTRASIR